MLQWLGAGWRRRGNRVDRCLATGGDRMRSDACEQRMAAAHDLVHRRQIARIARSMGVG
jgi:hypothetical protein